MRRRTRDARKAEPAPALFRREPVKVSDLALFRWLERAGVIDVANLRMALTTALDRAWQAAARIEQEEMLIHAGGMIFLVRDGTVVTVMNEDERPSPARSFHRLQRPGAAGEGGDVG